MGVRKFTPPILAGQGQQNIRKLTKLGKKSLAVTLPIELIKKLKWKEKQKLVVKQKGKSLVIRDWKK